MQSQVGNRQVYEDNEQRTYSKDEKASMEEEEALRNFTHNNAHNPTDASDSNNLRVRGERAEAQEREGDRERDAATITNPLAPAEKHGNEPSRGAKVDAELQEEDRKTLEKMGSYNGLNHA